MTDQPEWDTASRAIDSSVPRYISFLQQLLRIPNLRMQEHDSVRFLAKALREAGCQTEVFEGQGIGEPTPVGPPLNLFACRKGIGTEPSLLMEAHADTVPSGSLRNWKYGPWSGQIDKGRIYGRGAHDDRAGAALLWMVADVLHRLGIETRGDLYFLVTTEEEFSGGGMKSYVQRLDRIQPDAHLMVDGNQRDRCILGHAGALSFQVCSHGPFGSAQHRSMVHSANPIELMSLLVRTAAVRDRSESHPAGSWRGPALATGHSGCNRDPKHGLGKQCAGRVYRTWFRQCHPASRTQRVQGVF